MFKERVNNIISNENYTVLRKFQLSALEILLEVDRICRENNITYWMDAGTLLGAIRHGGFIPWDDDLDICVPREDYEKLRKLFECGYLPEGIVYEDKYTDTWWQEEMTVKPSFIKLYYLDNFRGYDHHENVNWKGAFIDIFPVDEVTESMTTNIFNIFTRIVSRRVMIKQKGIVNNIKAMLGRLNLDKVWVKKCKKIKGNKGVDYIVYGIETPFMEKRYLQNKSDIYPVKEIEFEGYKLFAPNDTHKYLTTQFGDYMVIPDEKDRHTHLSNIRI